MEEVKKRGRKPKVTPVVEEVKQKGKPGRKKKEPVLMELLQEVGEVKKEKSTSGRKPGPKNKKLIPGDIINIPVESQVKVVQEFYNTHNIETLPIERDENWVKRYKKTFVKAREEWLTRLEGGLFSDVLDALCKKGIKDGDMKAISMLVELLFDKNLVRAPVFDFQHLNNITTLDDIKGAYQQNLKLLSEGKIDIATLKEVTPLIEAYSDHLEKKDLQEMSQQLDKILNDIIPKICKDSNIDPKQFL